MEAAAKALVYSVPVTGLTVWIYKGSRRAETYLYVPEENNFERVPGELLDAMGTLTFVMELEIDEQRHLARVDGSLVFHSGADQWRFGPDERHRLTLHIRTHQRPVGVVVLQKGDERSADAHDLLR